MRCLGLHLICTESIAADDTGYSRLVLSVVVAVLRLITIRLAPQGQYLISPVYPPSGIQ